jgi:transposase
MMKRNFLSKDDRAALTRVARDGLEEHRVARRPNALLLLDKGWSCEQVSDALLLDDDTIRGWFKIYREGGVAALAQFDLAGGHRALNANQLDALKAWATPTLPASTRLIGHYIETSFGVSYTRSGLIKLMAGLDFVWRKPDLVPRSSILRRRRRSWSITKRSAMAWAPTQRSSTGTPSTRPTRCGLPGSGCPAGPISRLLRLRAVIA